MKTVVWFLETYPEFGWYAVGAYVALIALLLISLRINPDTPPAEEAEALRERRTW